ncbi:MAG: hypothetical protein EBU08_18045, partial [Micrococcales bacterium]|nr:hypothetical protein [Micrococcales bacterium]
MQLVAYGAQDVYLTGNPQITFFKVVYRRHTNFSMECIEQPLDSARFGGRHTVQVLRNGDLAGRMYLKTTLPALSSGVAWCRRPGHAILNYIECTVGGSQVDKHWGQWYDLWYELTHTVDQERGYNKMVGDVSELTTVSSSGTSAYTVYVPLQFWFNRNTGLALPLIALQYHEVRFNIEFNALADCVVKNVGTSVPSVDLSSTSILVDYIYLDQEERRRMAQVGHEYLIEQVQHNGEESLTGTNQKFKLDFNHPCKELVWAVRCGFLSSTSSRFLAYYNGDATATLQAAANNLAYSMVTVSAAAPTGYTALSAVGVSVEAVPVNTVGLINVTQGSTNFTFVVTNNGTGSYSGANLNVAYNIVTGVSSKVTDITVNVTIAPGASTPSAITASNVTANTFASLTLADVSVPVASIVTTDNRVQTSDVNISQPFNYGLDLAGNGNPVATAKIQLNGHDRFDQQDGDYFNYVQPYQHHTRTPADGVNVYSFGLHPEQHQPSGTANLSRIDTTQLFLTFADALDSVRTPPVDVVANSLLWIFAFSYNVFRIMS